MTMPDYVDRLGHNEVSILQPAAMLDTTVTMFGAAIDADKAQAYVDYVLTDRGGPKYQLLGNTAIFCFLHSPRATSLAQTIGWVGDHEVAVWLPVVERDGSSLNFMVWMPYIWLDTDIGMASGREIWGFPKAIGHYVPPTEPDEPYVLTTRIFPTFSDDTEGVQADLIRIDAASQPGESTFDKLEDFAHGLAGLFNLENGRHHFSWGDDLKLLVDFIELALKRTVPVVNLKQFRDAADGTKACYQSIVQSGLKVTGFQGAGILLGDHTVTITECASARLVEDLGFAGSSFTARFGAWATMSFAAEPGHEVWNAADS